MSFRSSNCRSLLKTSSLRLIHQAAAGGGSQGDECKAELLEDYW
jgi:hypothetical protein